MKKGEVKVVEEACALIQREADRVQTVAATHQEFGMLKSASLLANKADNLARYADYIASHIAKEY